MSKQTATHRSVHFHVEVGLLQLEATTVVLNFSVCKIYVAILGNWEESTIHYQLSTWIPWGIKFSSPVLYLISMAAFSHSASLIPASLFAYNIFSGIFGGFLSSQKNQTSQEWQNVPYTSYLKSQI